jgi:NitT/TauT family transport system substrate-binding protein
MENSVKSKLRNWVIAAALAGCGTAAQAQPLTKVTVMQPIMSYDVRYAPWAIAQKNGYFAQEGLDVDLPLTKGSLIVVQQLINGGAVYGILPPDAVTIANSKGANLKFFYSFTTKNPFPMAVLDDSKVKSLNDLRGKKIGVFSLSAVQFYIVQAIMKSAGMDKDKDYTLIDVGSGPAALVALQRGDVDAIAEDIIIYGGFNNRGVKFRYLTSPQVEKVFAWGLLSTDENLKKNPQQAVAIARGLTKGRIACEADTRKCIEAYFAQYPNAKPQGVDTETAIKEQETILKQFLAFSAKPDGEWGSYPAGSWDAVMTYLTGSSLIPAPVDQARMVTSDLLKDINKFDPASIK